MDLQAESGLLAKSTFGPCLKGFQAQNAPALCNIYSGIAEPTSVRNSMLRSSNGNYHAADTAEIGQLALMEYFRGLYVAMIQQYKTSSVAFEMPKECF